MGEFLSAVTNINRFKRSTNQPQLLNFVSFRHNLSQCFNNENLDQDLGFILKVSLFLKSEAYNWLYNTQKQADLKRLLLFCIFYHLYVIQKLCKSVILSFLRLHLGHFKLTLFCTILYGIVFRPHLGHTF